MTHHLPAHLVGMSCNVAIVAVDTHLLTANQNRDAKTGRPDPASLVRVLPINICTLFMPLD